MIRHGQFDGFDGFMVLLIEGQIFRIVCKIQQRVKPGGIHILKQDGLFGRIIGVHPDDAVVGVVLRIRIIAAGLFVLIFPAVNRPAGIGTDIGMVK